MLTRTPRLLRWEEYSGMTSGIGVCSVTVADFWAILLGLEVGWSRNLRTIMGEYEKPSKFVVMPEIAAAV
ncbi:hypothetical protein V6N12_073182 [Hibiscus sabdariffa]|uniref:Uncharacterized protein n=1 Tax=Hibiscus sabdariffa TaxID=183260 RepID=A0ABR2B6V5_9ROSI